MTGCYHTPKTRVLPVSSAAKCPDPPDGCGNLARRLPDRTAVLYHERGCPAEAAYEAEEAARHPRRGAAAAQAPPEPPPRPDKGSAEYDLWVAAIDVAINAPWRHAGHVTHAKVYWPRVEALRAALDRVGIDWREAKRQTEQRGEGGG